MEVKKMTTNDVAVEIKELIHKGETTLEDLRKTKPQLIQSKWFPSVNIAVVFTALQKIMVENL